MATNADAEIERRIDDAIEDALPDAAELAKVEARRVELAPEALAEDETYARELTDRLMLFAARVPIGLEPFRALIDAEVERRRTGRRRCAAHSVPLELLAEQASATMLETRTQVALSDATRAVAAAVERRTIADAVVRVFGTDRRERA